MRFLAPEDEKRLDALRWLQGAFLRGVQLDLERRDVVIFAMADRDLVELLCEDAAYATVPDLFGGPESPRIVGLVVQPLDEAFVVRLEFSNHPAQVHLQCGSVAVRRYPPEERGA